jgi:hypothetical protein
MPRTVTRQPKKILITEATYLILNAYQGAITDLAEEQKKMLGLSPDPNPVMDGFPRYWSLLSGRQIVNMAQRNAICRQ